MLVSEGALGEEGNEEGQKVNTCIIPCKYRLAMHNFMIQYFKEYFPSPPFNCEFLLLAAPATYKNGIDNSYGGVSFGNYPNFPQTLCYGYVGFAWYSRHSGCRVQGNLCIWKRRHG